MVAETAKLRMIAETTERDSCVQKLIHPRRLLRRGLLGTGLCRGLPAPCNGMQKKSSVPVRAGSDYTVKQCMMQTALA